MLLMIVPGIISAIFGVLFLVAPQLLKGKPAHQQIAHAGQVNNEKRVVGHLI